MNFPRYELSANADLTVFEFTSIGKNGTIQKAIKYSQTSNSQVYNLGFGDIIFSNEQTGEVEIDDEAVTNNGDIGQVLGTVAASVYAFTERYPEAFVLFGGSDTAKVRLYRMILSRYYDEITRTFLLFGAEHNKRGQLVNVPFSFDDNVEGYFIKRG
jgi:hypothetical protein